jgi:hypothetical protein
MAESKYFQDLGSVIFGGTAILGQWGAGQHSGLAWSPTAASAPTGGAAVTADINQPKAEYGAVIPISMGTRRMGPQLIWAKPITGDDASGYFADFAVSWGYNGDSDPAATEITRLWANGALIWEGGAKKLPGDWSVTLYTGTETQTADPTLSADLGAATPGFRNQIYGVFKRFPITRAWNFSLPGISAEISGTLDATHDWVVVRVMWDEAAGGNFEFTLALDGVGASVDGVPVGFSSHGSSTYIKWGGDTDGAYGLYSWYIDCAALRAAFPTVSSFNLLLKGYNYNPFDEPVMDRLTGGITHEVTTYKGGTMSHVATFELVGDEYTRGGWDSVNTGGTLVGTSTGSGSVPTGSEHVNAFAGYAIATLPTSAGGIGAADEITIPQLINRVAGYAGLDPATDISIDPSITDTVAGALIAAETDFGDFTRNLGQWFGFDSFEGTTIEFVRPVNGATYTLDATIPPEDLLYDNDRAITTTRGEDNSPVILEGRYIDRTQQFRYTPQRARRILFPVRSTDSQRQMSLAVPVVMSANQAITYLGKAIYRMAAQNVGHSFNLPPRYLFVEPADILNVTAGGTSYTVKVSRVEFGPEKMVTISAINLLTDEDISLEGSGGSSLVPYAGGTAPTNTVAPAITGTADVGETLTASTGTWTGSPPISYAYVWTADESIIPGANASTYVLASGDDGKSIRVTITASNSYGSASATSDPVGGGAPAATITLNTPNGGTFPVSADEVDLAVVSTPADMASLISITLPLQAGGTVATGGLCRAAVYDSTTQALIAAGDEVTLTGSETELVLSFAAPVTLSPSHSYDIGLHSNTALSLQDSDSGLCRYVSAVYVDGAPDPLVAATTAAETFVLTLTYNPI